MLFFVFVLCLFWGCFLCFLWVFCLFVCLLFVCCCCLFFCGGGAGVAEKGIHACRFLAMIHYNKKGFITTQSL